MLSSVNGFGPGFRNFGNDLRLETSKQSAPWADLAEYGVVRPPRKGRRMFELKRNDLNEIRDEKNVPSHAHRNAEMLFERCTFSSLIACKTN